MAQATLLQAPQRRWECLKCDHTDVTYEHRPHSRFHHCRGMAGMWAPMVPAGTRGEMVAVERGDWIGKEDVQYDGNGRPVMAIQVIRDNGMDCAVYAPCARVREG